MSDPKLSVKVPRPAEQFTGSPELATSELTKAQLLVHLTSLMLLTAISALVCIFIVLSILYPEIQKCFVIVTLFPSTL